MNNNLQNQPHTLSGRQLLAKTLIGLLLWTLISLLLFLILSFAGSLFTQAMMQWATEFSRPNPLLPLLLLLIGFLITVVGNMIVAGVYNLFYNEKYYDAGKMFGLLLLTNGFLFLFLAPLYLFFYNDMQNLFVILGLHVILSIFVSSIQIESLSNPNYTGSALIGNVFWLAVSLLLYVTIYNLSGSGSMQQTVYILLVFPAVIGFTIMPLCLGIWEKIYYKFYEMGNDPFYMPSLQEVTTTDEDNEESDDDDINVDL